MKKTLGLTSILILLVSNTVLFGGLAEDTLTLRVSGVFSESADALFHERHPEVKLEYTDEKWASSDELGQAMVSQNVQCDIYTLSMDWGFDALKKKQFCADLSSSESISSFAQSLLPPIQEAIWDKSSLAAIPFSINLRLLGVDQSVSELMPEQYYPKTYVDYINLLLESDDVLETYDINVTLDMPDKKTAMDDLIRQFVLYNEHDDKPLDFDDSDFKKAAEQISLLPDATSMSELDYERMSQRPTWIFLNPFPLDTSVGGDNLVLTPIPPISTHMTPIVEANLDLIVINPHSQQKDLALEYVECFIQSLSPREKMLLSAQFQGQVEDPEYSERVEMMKEELKEYQEVSKQKELAYDNRMEMEDRIALIEAFLSNDKNRWAITQQEIDTYYAITPTIVIPYGSLFLGFDGGSALEGLTEISDRFISSQIHIDRMIQELNHKAQMVFHEGK